MDERAQRRARRDFVRDHHPDRGGDPAAFVAGLAAFDDRRPGHRTVRVQVVKREPWPGRAVRAALQRVGKRAPTRVR